jgi:hypothetical protein
MEKQGKGRVESEELTVKTAKQGESLLANEDFE